MNHARPRVLIVQQPISKKRDHDGVLRDHPAFDFSPAEAFGTIELLAPNGKHILTPDVFREMLADKLADFEPDRDFIIPAGDYSVLLYVGMLLGARHKHIQILRWVSDARAYQPLHLYL